MIVHVCQSLFFFFFFLEMPSRFNLQDLGRQIGLSHPTLHNVRAQCQYFLHCASSAVNGRVDPKGHNYTEFKSFAKEFNFTNALEFGRQTVASVGSFPVRATFIDFRSKTMAAAVTTKKRFLARDEITLSWVAIILFCCTVLLAVWSSFQKRLKANAMEELL